LYSRFSKVLRLVYPLVPQPPSAVIIDFSVPLAPVLNVQLPLNTDRNIYGVQIDNGGAVLSPPSIVTLVSDDPTDNRLVILAGFDSQGNPLLEELNMTGTAPVDSVNTYAILEFIQFPGCGGGVSGAGQGGGGIGPGTLVITTAFLPNATVGNPYDVFLTATGGVPPYMWTITAGALPTGLTLSPEGEISGTPTTAGVFDFIIQVQDSSMTVRRLSVRLAL
jgi:Putative Ig domain